MNYPRTIDLNDYINPLLDGNKLHSHHAFVLGVRNTLDKLRKRLMYFGSLLLLSLIIVCKSSYHNSLKYFLAFSIFLMTFSAISPSNCKVSNSQCQGVNFWGAQCQGADFLGAQCQGANFRDAQCQGANFRNAQCQGAYALKTFSFRIDKNTEFETLQLEGEIAENVIKNIENAEKYLSESRYEDLQTIIQDNKSKEPKYGTIPELNSCE
jgi:hypothetical protein